MTKYEFVLKVYHCVWDAYIDIGRTCFPIRLLRRPLYWITEQLSNWLVANDPNPEELEPGTTLTLEKLEAIGRDLLKEKQ